MTYCQIIGVYGGYSRGYNVRIQLRDSEQEVFFCTFNNKFAFSDIRLVPLPPLEGLRPVRSEKRQCDDSSRGWCSIELEK